MSERRFNSRGASADASSTPLRRLTAGCLAAFAVTLAGPAGAQDYDGYGQPDFDVPDYHVVKEGDTLWDLSGRYYGDTYQWPKVWSYNPHVTNPHWIYPGDVVYLTGQEERQPEDEAERNNVTDVRSGFDVKPGMRLPTAGFVSENKPEFVGRIVASPKEGRLLGQYDSVWVGFGDEANQGKMKKMAVEDRPEATVRDPGEVKKKDRFAIVRQGDVLKNEDGDEIGRKYQVLGSLVITKTSEKNLETAYIDRSWKEISRGDYLIPFERQLKVVQHVKADKDLVAKIIGSMRGHFDFGESHYVYVNKGAADGVRVGNRMYIYQRRTGLPNEWRKPPKNIPWRRVGRVRILDTRENFSTAVITDSKREIGMGDRLEMYQGN